VQVAWRALSLVTCPWGSRRVAWSGGRWEMLGWASLTPVVTGSPFSHSGKKVPEKGEESLDELTPIGV
jgi:hypothetical protein